VLRDEVICSFLFCSATLTPHNYFSFNVSRNPGSTNELSNNLYHNPDLVAAFYNALTEDGVLVTSLGPRRYESLSESASLRSNLRKQGFQDVKVYEDMHGGFTRVSDFAIAFKRSTDASNKRWNANEALVDVELRNRLFPTKSGRSLPLRFFDGATMRSMSRISSDND